MPLLHPKPLLLSFWFVASGALARASFGRVVVVLFLVPRHEIALGRRRRLRAFLNRVLEQHVHEQVHWLGLDDQGAGGLLGTGVEMLMHAVVMHDSDIAGLPIVADAVVDLVAGA